MNLKLKIKYFILPVTASFLMFGYMNCAKKIELMNENIFSSVGDSNSQFDCVDCPADQDTDPVYYSLQKNDQFSGKEIVHSQQTIDNLFHLLNASPVGFGMNEKNNLFNEKDDRLGILVQLNKTTKVNSVNVASLISMSGEICRTYIYNQVRNNQGISFLTDLDLTKTVDQIDSSESLSYDQWLNVSNQLANQFWSRNLTDQENLEFMNFIKMYISEAKKIPEYQVMQLNKNLMSLNLAVSLCTAISAAPESNLL